MEVSSQTVSNPNNVTLSKKADSLHFGSRCSNKYERTPQSDCVSLPKKEKGGFFSSLGKIIAESLDKNSKELKQKREIEALKKTSERLIGNIDEVQKSFQDVFMRKDISQSEALKMIQRYHQIEMIGITGSKEEYINALYEEAKKNFGFEDLPISIRSKSGCIGGNPRMLGFTDPLGEIIIRSDIPNDKIFNTIHHELRHVKQNYYAFNFDAEEFVKLSQPKNMEIPKEVFECAYNCTPGKENIEEEYMDFAEKSLVSKQGYCAASKDEAGYLSQWCEEDAFRVGNKMESLFRRI